MSNPPILQALSGQKTDYTPIWIMRQAGRYLPEYRKLRASVGGFMDLCTNPELAAQVTLQPLQRFPLDAAIIFSDILVIPDAYGLGLGFKAGEGPYFERPINTISDVDNIADIDVTESLSYVFKALKNVKSELEKNKALLGFAGSPWTVATYMLEGGSSKTFSKAKAWIYKQPQALHKLLDKLTLTTTKYLKQQILAGADAVMLFDSWGGILSPEAFNEFSLSYLKKIVASIKTDPQTKHAPVILFAKGVNVCLPDLALSGANALQLDWTISLSLANELTRKKVTLQGNLDPCVLYGDKATIKKEVYRVLESAKDCKSHIFNLGHGIYPDIEPDKVAYLVDLVHQFQ